AAARPALRRCRKTSSSPPSAVRPRTSATWPLRPRWRCSRTLSRWRRSSRSRPSWSPPTTSRTRGRTATTDDGSVVKQIPSGERPERRGVRSVDRALDLLLAFSATRPRLHLRDLAQAVGLPKPSTHRIATTLLERGFLRQEPDGSYSLGSRLLELGGLVSSTAALAQLTRDAVTELSAQTGETILVAEVDWTDGTALLIRRRDATHPLAVTSPVGERSGLGNGCIGKAILGAMDPVAAGELIPRLHLVRRTERSVVDREQFAREI